MNIQADHPKGDAMADYWQKQTLTAWAAADEAAIVAGEASQALAMRELLPNIKQAINNSDSEALTRLAVRLDRIQDRGGR